MALPDRIFNFTPRDGADVPRLLYATTPTHLPAPATCLLHISKRHSCSREQSPRAPH